MVDPILPQRATRTAADVQSVDWLFEPSWPGDRLLARVSGGRLSLTDAFGEPAEEAFAEACGVLRDALLVEDALLDGVWTAQPFIGDGSPARAWAETLAEEGLEADVPDPIETERRRAFVAVDLIELDREPLYDVPFQERRRLLEGVLVEGVQVRLSPLVKQPISGWLQGWRANGFTYYIAKHMNSRYAPGSVCAEWLEISVHAPPPRGLLGRMFTPRQRTPKIGI